MRVYGGDCFAAYRSYQATGFVFLLHVLQIVVNCSSFCFCFVVRFVLYAFKYVFNAFFQVVFSGRAPPLEKRTET